MPMRTWWQQARAWLRELTGDDAYERYVQHHQQHHDDQVLLNRQQFYLTEQQRKWSGVKRCC